jgi:hypothetical protein
MNLLYNYFALPLWLDSNSRHWDEDVSVELLFHTAGLASPMKGVEQNKLKVLLAFGLFFILKQKRIILFQN